MIGLIGAMAVEVEALEKKLEGRRETTIGRDSKKWRYKYVTRYR